MTIRDDLTGKKFGKLMVLGLSNKRGSRGTTTRPLWECRCECGAITYKYGDILKNNDLKESKKNTDRPQYYVTNNHPAIIDSKEQITVIFVGGLKVVQPLTD